MNLIKNSKRETERDTERALIKESIQKQLLTEQMFFEIGVLKNFAIF